MSLPQLPTELSSRGNSGSSAASIILFNRFQFVVAGMTGLRKGDWRLFEFSGERVKVILDLCRMILKPKKSWENCSVILENVDETCFR